MKMEDFMVHDFNITKISCLMIQGCAKNSPKRSRADYALIFYPEGGYSFHFTSGLSIRTGKNTILFMPQSACYDIEFHEKHDCWSITFELDTEFDCEPFLFSVRDVQYFFDCFKDIEHIYKQAQSGYVMGCKSRLCAIISAMQHEYSLGYISGQLYSAITPAIDMIHNCYTGRTPSVPELANLCGVSPEYFRMLFKKKHGKSPVKYINDLRFCRAKELLSSGMYTVSEAAALSGFSELPYFSREFRKRYGISPSIFVCKNKSGF